MKFIIILLSILLVIYSCGKSNINPNGYLQFGVGDSLVQIKDKGAPFYSYTSQPTAFVDSTNDSSLEIYATKGIIIKFTINWSIPIKPGIYHNDSTFQSPFGIFAVLNGDFYRDIENQPFTVVITRRSNGTIDGTFYGPLTGIFGAIVPITQGEFRNLKIVFQ
jgi:hypothetical protein